MAHLSLVPRNPPPADPDEAVLDALHAARIELGAFLRHGAGPSTQRAFDAVCAAIDTFSTDPSTAMSA